VAICLAVAVGSIGSLNNVIHTNFMFLSWPAKGTPLEIFDLWFGALGSHGYLLGLVLLLITLWLIEYLPWLFADLRQERKY
jgi:prolipoprotein diacylglyceryltransferase